MCYVILKTIITSCRLVYINIAHSVDRRHPRPSGSANLPDKIRTSYSSICGIWGSWGSECY